MKLRVEYTDGDEEVIIRCKERGERITDLEQAINSVLKGERELILTIGNTEYYMEKQDIIFFESNDGKVFAHTADQMYTCAHKLYELEDRLPSYFVRISKSVIANIRQIASLRRELTGNGEITFKQCQKVTYFSRGYYHQLKDKIREVRFSL